MSTPNSNVHGLTPRKQSTGQSRTPVAQAAINKIAASVNSLLHEDVRGYWDDAGVQKRESIVYGAYNQITFRAEDGTVKHACGNHINEMRDERQYTRNAVELRCEALGLAVYISGYKQVDMGTRSLRKCLRVASYRYKAKIPEVALVQEAAELYSRLHTILVSTYNLVAREYNIAGLRTEDLTLVSNFPEMIPNVAINQPC